MPVGTWETRCLDVRRMCEPLSIPSGRHIRRFSESDPKTVHVDVTAHLGHRLGFLGRSYQQLLGALDPDPMQLMSGRAADVIDKRLMQPARRHARRTRQITNANRLVVVLPQKPQ